MQSLGSGYQFTTIPVQGFRQTDIGWVNWSTVPQVTGTWFYCTTRQDSNTIASILEAHTLEDIDATLRLQHDPVY